MVIFQESDGNFVIPRTSNARIPSPRIYIDVRQGQQRKTGHVTPCDERVLFAYREMTGCSIGYQLSEIRVLWLKKSLLFKNSNAIFSPLSSIVYRCYLCAQKHIMRPMEIDMIWGNTDKNRICFLRRTGIAYVSSFSFLFRHWWKNFIRFGSKYFPKFTLVFGQQKPQTTISEITQTRDENNTRSLHYVATKTAKRVEP